MSAGSTRLTTVTARVQPSAASDSRATLTALTTSSAGRPLPLTSASTGAPRWLATWALKSNSSAADVPV